MGFGFNGFSTGMFDIIGILVPLGVIAGFVIIISRLIKEWHTNNKSPRLTVPATVVTKRTSVSHHHHHHGTGAMHHSTSSTSYYVTFQVESGDRMELSVPGIEFGMLVEGDHGNLSFQGTRYLGFQRQ